MWNTFFQLLRRDFVVFYNGFSSKFLSALFSFVSTVIVFNFIFIALVSDENYGLFILMGSIVKVGLIESFNNIPMILSDLEDDNSIYYYLSLPLPHWLLFVRYAISFAVQSFVFSMVFLALSKIFLWNIFDLSGFSFFKCMLFFPMIHIFYGFFAVFVSMYIYNVDQYDKAWSRVAFPLLTIGCYQFSWYTMLKQTYWLAYVNLLNPVIYVFEGFRAAFLGQEGYINFWVCCGMILLFAALSAYFGIKKFMKRLDCVG